MKKLILFFTILMTSITANIADIHINQQTHTAEAYGRSNINYYQKGSCVYYAFNRRAQLHKPVSNQWSNAKYWPTNARKSGYKVSNRPAKYAVMISQKGYYGHAAIVERVNRNGSILVSEMNYPRNGVKTYRTLSKYEASYNQFIY